MGTMYHQDFIDSEDTTSHLITLMPKLTHQMVEIHFMQKAMALYQRQPSVEDAIDIIAQCVTPT